jgi:hypothetical protein
MKKLILILASLILVGPNLSHAEEPNLFCVDSNYMPIRPFYKTNSIKDCKKYGYNNITVDKEIYSRLKENLTLENSAYNENLLKEYAIEKQKKEKSQREERKNELIKLYSKKCVEFKKDPNEFDKCLVDEEKKVLLEQRRITNLPPSERYAYTCEKTYGFKKGSDNFRDCVFKIMTTEYEIQRAADQRRIAELESKINNNNNNVSSSFNNELLEIERLKAKALQDQANAIRNRNQTDALMDLSRSLLNNNNRAPANVPNLPLNCRSVRVGNTVQTQCY